MMEYKGYLGTVEFDDEAGIVHGEVVNTRDVITFQGTSVEELRTALRESVEDYLAFCTERGELAHCLLGAGRRFAPDLDAVAELIAERENEG